MLVLLLLGTASLAFAMLGLLLAASDEPAAGAVGPCILIILLTLRSSAISFSTRSCSFRNIQLPLSFNKMLIHPSHPNTVPVGQGTELN